jgi:hypothetical protein
MSIILPGSWGKQGPIGKWKVEGTTAAGDPYNRSLEVVRDSDELLKYYCALDFSGHM